MTGRLPYEHYNSELGVTAAIRGMELPADLTALDLPLLVRQTLQICWQRSDFRPTIRLCEAVIVSPWDFSLLARLPMDEVPSRLRVLRCNERAICNPAIAMGRPPELDFTKTPSIVALSSAERASGYVISTPMNRSRLIKIHASLRPWTFSPDGQHIAVANPSTVSFHNVDTLGENR